jgi:hypothetical protein
MSQLPLHYTPAHSPYPDDAPVTTTEHKSRSLYPSFVLAPVRHPFFFHDVFMVAPRPGSRSKTAKPEPDASTHSGQNNWPHAEPQPAGASWSLWNTGTGEDILLLLDESKSCAARSFRSGGPDTDVHCKARVWSVGSCSSIGGQWRCKDDPDRSMHVRVSPMWRARAEAGARGLAYRYRRRICLPDVVLASASRHCWRHPGSLGFTGSLQTIS